MVGFYIIHTNSRKVHSVTPTRRIGWDQFFLKNVRFLPINHTVRSILWTEGPNLPIRFFLGGRGNSANFVKFWFLYRTRKQSGGGSGSNFGESSEDHGREWRGRGPDRLLQRDLPLWNGGQYCRPIRHGICPPAAYWLVFRLVFLGFLHLQLLLLLVCLAFGWHFLLWS